MTDDDVEVPFLLAGGNRAWVESTEAVAVDVNARKVAAGGNRAGRKPQEHVGTVVGCWTIRSVVLAPGSRKASRVVCECTCGATVERTRDSLIRCEREGRLLACAHA